MKTTLFPKLAALMCRPLSQVKARRAPWQWRYGLHAIAALSVLIVQAGSAGPAPRGRDLIAVIDHSGSTIHVRPALLQSCLRLSTQYRAAGDQLFLYRFARETEEIYAGKSLTKRDLAGLLKREAVRTAKERGTSWPAMLEAAANAAEVVCTQQVDLAIFSDGGNDFGRGQDLERMRKAVQNLAKNPRLRRVLLVGVEPKHRDFVRKAFAALKDKVQILLPGQDATAG